jgi:aspartyl-tRNA(Asn)/glutamyl-tRNA(Gln) amidotransferase subunit A
MAEEIYQLSATEISSRLAAGKLTSRAVVEALIVRYHQLNKKIGAFTSLDEKDVLAQADASDARRKAGKVLSLLDGIPVAIKENIAVKGQPLTCSSKMLANLVSPYDAHVVEALKSAGAIIYGRLNMDEFAMGSSTENSAIQKTFNPWDLACIPGGSSGGSAASLASGLVPLALGSDTGGSIRQPASHCGIVGMKPTYGLVSRFGLVAFASSLDQIGPMARTVADCELLLKVLATPDARDMTCFDSTQRSQLPVATEKSLRIGIPKGVLGKGVGAEVAAATQAAIDFYKSKGATIIEVDLPSSELAVPTYYVVATAEASSNLARYDGVRYGHRSSNAQTPIEMMTNSRSEGFGPEVKRRILLGTFVLSAGYADAYYVRALRARSKIRAEHLVALEKVDMILSPTVPTPAFKVGEKVSDPLQLYLEDIFTIPANLAGLPALSVPCGKSGHLPVGFHLVGAPLSESKLFAAAQLFESAHSFANQQPTL